MAYLSDETAVETPVPVSDIVGIVGLFYLAILVIGLAVGIAFEGNRGAATPALDWTYASSFTA